MLSEVQKRDNPLSSTLCVGSADSITGSEAEVLVNALAKAVVEAWANGADPRT